MLKKSASELEIREACFVKHRSFLDQDVSRFTFHEQRGRASGGWFCGLRQIAILSARACERQSLVR
jgi:hypothetical protein